MRVEIAGAGIIGLSIAWRLAQRGVKVTVRDRKKAASESSWAGAGMLAPGGEFRSGAVWTHRAVASLRQFGPFVQELTEATGIAIDYRVCGALELACTDEEEAALVAGIDRQRRFGIRAEQLDLNSARASAPIASSGVSAAAWYPDEAIVDPRDVCSALLAACRRLGVEIRENEPVQRLSTPAVVAAGAWASDLELPEGAPGSFPVKGHLIGYHLRPGSLGPIVRRGHHYALQRASGFTLFGSDEQPREATHTVDPRSIRALTSSALDLLPGLLFREPDEAWAGLRPGSETGDPVVGRHGSSDVWLAYGHYRNGILLAPWTAEYLATEITAS